MRSGLLAVFLALSLTPACGNDGRDLDDPGDEGTDDVAIAGGEPIGGGAPRAEPDRGNHPLVEVLVADAGLYSSELTVAGDRIYWVAKGVDGYELRFVRPTGGPITTLVKFGDEPLDLVFAGDDVYWAAERRGRLLRTSVDVPGPIEVLYRDAAAVPSALTASQKYVYFGATDGCVRRIGLGDASAALPVACGSGTPVVIAAADTEVFWGTAEDGLLYQAPAGGGAADKRIAGESWDSRLYIDDSQIYWLNAQARAVQVMARDAHGVKPLARAQYAPAGMTMDRFDVYFTTWSDQSIKRVAKVESPVEVLVGEQADPADIALRDERAYWINEGQGTIMQMVLP